MRISHKHKFVFLALPRTGSTTVRTVLDPYADVKSVRITEVTEDVPFYHHIPARRLKSLFDDRGWDWYAYRRFCVVRNPFDRVVSLYHHFKGMNADRARARTSLRYLARFLFYQVRPGVSFRSYVMKLNPRDPLTISLKEFITDADGNVLVDDVLTFESLATLLPAYLQQMGIDLREADIPVLNSSNDRRAYSLYYTPETREKVESVYAYELQRFSYAFDDDPTGKAPR